MTQDDECTDPQCPRSRERPYELKYGLPRSEDPIPEGWTRVRDAGAPHGLLDMSPEFARRQRELDTEWESRQPAAGPWIAVTERMPEKGKTVLFASKIQMYVGSHEAWGWSCDCDEDPEGVGVYEAGQQFAITHWAEIHPRIGQHLEARLDAEKQAKHCGDYIRTEASRLECLERENRELRAIIEKSGILPAETGDVP